MMATWEWRPIPGFDYEINLHGQVRRRSVIRGKRPKVLRPWFVRGVYPCVSLRRDGRTFRALIPRLLGQVFLGLTAGQEMDHRRLRVSTRREIIHACPGKANSSSEFKGVSLTRDGRWFSCIELGGRTRALGVFRSERAAARAYDAAAKRAWGKSAFLNFRL